MGWEIDVGEVHCGGFKFRGGKRIRQTVLFAEDQRELLGEREVCLQVPESGLRLPARVISGRPCVYTSVFVFVPRNPEGSNKLRWQWGSLRRGSREARSYLEVPIEKQNPKKKLEKMGQRNATQEDENN